MNPLVIIDNNDKSKAYEIDGECMKIVDHHSEQVKSKYYCNIKPIQYVDEECLNLSSKIKTFTNDAIKECVYSKKNENSDDFCKSLFTNDELEKINTCYENNTKVELDISGVPAQLHLDPNWKFNYILKAVDTNIVRDICFGEDYPISNNKCSHL